MINDDAERQPASGEPSWHLDSDTPLTPPYAPSQAQMHAAAARGHARMWFYSGVVSRSDQRRFSGSDGMQSIRKSLWMELGFGVPGALLIAGQFWAVELSRLAGWEPGEYSTWLRLAMICAGAWLIFVASPLYQPHGWTPAAQRELNAAHEHVRSKRGF